MNWLLQVWPHLVAAFGIVIAVVASGHAILYKRDPRAAVLWTVIIWLVPVIGAVLYLTIGINRVRELGLSARMHRNAPPISDASGETVDVASRRLHGLAQLVNRVAANPLTAGNRIEMLVNGDAAYPEMLAAIESARETISLCTYIFDNDAAGQKFVAALGRAVERGVDVRVIVDAAGARYSWPPIFGPLRAAGVKAGKFRPVRGLSRLTTFNLRNHRKIMIVDGRLGFTGGMNIRVGNLLAQKPRRPVQDLNFRVEGPVVAHLQNAFLDDWFFVTGEELPGAKWLPPLAPVGEMVARGMTDGPDSNYETIRWTIQAALASARQRVRIVTPYFLPDSVIISAINLAALRNVQVDIILPSENNLPYMHWASRAIWWQVLRHGCRVWLTPAPFDHTKLMLVDDEWALVGSANWDTRSLRLNFELNLECYGADLTKKLERLVQSKLEGAHEVTLAEVDARALPTRLQDGVARLFMPYL